MKADWEIIFFSFAAIACIFVAILAYKRILKFKKGLLKGQEDARRQMYEIAILKELGERIGYSLNLKNIIGVIIDSLPQLIEYSMVSFALLEPGKVVFKMRLQKPLPRSFVDQVREKMAGSLSAFAKIDFSKVAVKEELEGSAVDDKSDVMLQSFFNIPLVMAGRPVGLLTVSDTRPDFYREEEMATLYKIAGQASQAVLRLRNVIESEQSKLNAMVESIAEGVIMADSDFRIVVINPAARKYLGINGNAPTIFEVVDSLSGKFDVKGKLEESIMLGKNFLSGEIELASGFFKIVACPVKNNEQILGGAIILHDITSDKEIERIKEDFTSMIVHELRSPLDTIKKMVEVMRTEPTKKAQKEEYFQMIHRSSFDMLELVNNLLDMAKMEAGKFELFIQPYDIKDIVNDRMIFFKIPAKDGKIKLSACFSQDLPEKADFDAHTVSQVLSNLISNGLKFNQENGKVDIQVLFHKTGRSLLNEAREAGFSWFINNEMPVQEDCLFVAVTNTGTGIAKDQIDKLFNKFVQAKSVFAKKGGTGLGLAITKSIIEAHGGIVGAQSIEKQGATFYFTLPVASAGNHMLIK